MRAFLVMMTVVVGLVGSAPAQTSTPLPQTRLADGSYPDLFRLTADTTDCYGQAGLSMEQLARIMAQLERGTPAADIAAKDKEQVLAYAACMNARGYVLPYEKWNR